MNEQWDDVSFEISGRTRDRLEADADEAMKALAGDADYRFEMDIRGINQVGGIPQMWLAHVKGYIRAGVRGPRAS